MRKEQLPEEMRKRVALLEAGELCAMEAATLFQDLIDDDLVRLLPENYQSCARALIEAGVCFPRVLEDSHDG